MIRMIEFWLLSMKKWFREWEWSAAAALQTKMKDTDMNMDGKSNELTALFGVELMDYEVARARGYGLGYG